MTVIALVYFTALVPPGDVILQSWFISQSTNCHFISAHIIVFLVSDQELLLQISPAKNFSNILKSNCEIKAEV